MGWDARMGRLLLPTLLVVAAAVRLGFFLEFAGTDLAAVPILDAETYHTWAARLVAGDAGWHETYWMGPLYPHWLALIYAVAGVKMAVAHALQLVLTVLNVWLVHRLALALLRAPDREREARIAALVAAALYAFYGTPVFYAGFLLMAVFTTTLMLVVALQATEAAARPTPVRWLVLGLLTGLTALARGNVLLLLPVLPWLLARRPDLKGRRLRPILLFAAGVLAMVLPVTVRNVVLARDLVLLTTNAGVNLLIGQQPDSDGLYSLVVDELEADYDPTFEANVEWERGRDVKGSEVSRILARRAWATFRANLGAMPGLYARKIWRFWSGYEVPQITAYEYWRGEFTSLRLLPVPYLMLSALGLAGFLHLPPRARLVLGLLIGAYFLSLLPFFPTARYRQPIAPLLAVSAAWWLVVQIGSWRGRLTLAPRARRVSLVVACVLGVLLLPRWTALGRTEVLWQVHMYKALRASRLGKVREALTQGRLAEETRPGLPETPFRLGMYLGEAGAVAEGEAALRLADVRRPEHRLVLYTLAENLESQERLDEALVVYARSAAADPAWAYPWLRSGLILQRTDRPAEALAAMIHAHGLMPGNMRVRANLGALFAENGQLAEARRVLGELTRDYPVYVNGWFNLALVEWRAGDRAAAHRALDRAAALRNLSRAERLQVDRLAAAFSAAGDP